MLNKLARLLFGNDEENLRDLYNERDLMIATQSQLARDLKTINAEIRAEERRQGVTPC